MSTWSIVVEFQNWAKFNHLLHNDNMAVWVPRLGSVRAAAYPTRARIDTPLFRACATRRYLADRRGPTEENARQETGESSASSEPSKPMEPSFTTSTSKRAAANDKLPLPYLSRPLGVSARPTSETKTWLERHPEWFDREVRLEKRRQIVKEATRGYFHDFHEMRSHGGKTWRSPNTMIRHDVCWRTDAESALFPRRYRDVSR